MATNVKIFITCICILFMIAVFLPLIEAEFSNTTSSSNIDGNQIAEDLGNSGINIFKIIASVSTILLFTILDVPFWIDAIIILIRIIAWVALLDMVIPG